ncbi:hypothetical protein VNO80_02086 [Phaseolus coccineus]|uniref:Uncharacterized protein n=1 Tax=Phaseolus coccineus TaxID=3886 RepID=A0AAN9NTF3_PHACN
MGSVPTMHEPKLIELKDLRRLRPWNTPSLPLSKVGRYMKVKEPIYRNGVRVYWQQVIEEDEEDENPVYEIPYEGVFKFFNTRFFSLIGSFVVLPQSHSGEEIELHSNDLIEQMLKTKVISSGQP